MNTIVNASPLIFLAKLDYLEALGIFNKVYMADIVIEEIRAGLEKGYPDAIRVTNMVETGKLTVMVGEEPKIPVKGLHPGEASVIQLARKLGIKDVIIDDRHAIAAAKYFGLRPASTPYLLLLNVKNGKLGKKRFRSLMDGLMGQGYYISPRLYLRIMEVAGAL